MYYQGGKIASVGLELTKGQVATVGCISLAEFEISGEVLGFPAQCLASCKAQNSRYHSNLEVYDQFSFGVLHLLNLAQPRAARGQVALCFRKNLFLLVLIDDMGGEAQKSLERAVEMAASHFTIERVLSGFLMQLLAGSNDILADCERTVVHMEEAVLENEETKSLNRKIFQIKNDLILRKGYYDELLTLGEALQEDENALFGDAENFRHLKVLTDRLLRLSGNVQLLCENLVHVREAYQSSMDYRLNAIMKLFTVVTTIFLPLTLIAGWYGMNFVGMPELAWEYGYPSVVGVSLGVVALCFWFFHKRKLL